MVPLFSYKLVQHCTWFCPAKKVKEANARDKETEAEAAADGDDEKPKKRRKMADS